jgi:hypothetical protein
MGLSANQTHLTSSILALNKPTILLLQGGRPFALPAIYSRAAAVLSAFFPGQSGGQAIADVLFGTVNPGGRVPVSVPMDVGQLPAYYNFKQTARKKAYVDIESMSQWPFGWGLSYTTWAVEEFRVSVLAAGDSSQQTQNFTRSDTLLFTASTTNTGPRDGSYVAQIYLLQRVSTIVQPLKQLVAFQRVYVQAGETGLVSMEVEVDRYLRVLNRKYEWEVEKGSYTFAMLDHGGWDATWNADVGGNVTLVCL